MTDDNRDRSTLGDWGDYDDADLFGLDASGSVVGINPNWGVVASGLGTLAAVGVQQMSANPKLQKASEAVGLGVGAVVGIGLIIPKKTRAAGWAALFSSIVNHGPRVIASYLSKGEDAAIAARAGVVQARKMGVPAATTTATTTQGVEVQEIRALGNGQFGLVMPEATRALGAAPHDELPQLVGSHLDQAQKQVQLLGGPTLMSIAGHFGSTHFNKAA
jgi:hypothetical protein